VDSAVMREAPDGAGPGGSEVTSGTATFMRRDRAVRFDRQVIARRVAQTIEADSAIAHLTPDQQRIDTLELHGQPKITGVNPAVGGLEGLTGRDMTLKYGAGGEALEHAVVVGDAAIQLAGEAGAAGRQIKANNIDIGLAPDGSTPEALAARDGVTVTFPAAPGG